MTRDERAHRLREAHELSALGVRWVYDMIHAARKTVREAKPVTRPVANDAMPTVSVTTSGVPDTGGTDR